VRHWHSVWINIWLGTGVDMIEIKIELYAGQRDKSLNQVNSVLKFGVDRWGENHPLKYAFNWGGETEEGYSYEELSIEADFERNCLILEVSSESKDCDGRYSNYRAFESSIDDIENLQAKFEPVESHQRDYSAEAMNY
jgi:hypothetical protein